MHDNGRTVCVWHRRLGVAFTCGHRALIELERAGIHRSDMDPVYGRKFRCSKCGGHGVQLLVMQSDEDDRTFVSCSEL
jgi:hypothetical protein